MSDNTPQIVETVKSLETESISDPCVVFSHVSKEYPSNSSKKGLRRSKVKAVHDVSFVARKGESIGLLGQNGSGKSTLLRMVAGRSSPPAALCASAPSQRCLESQRPSCRTCRARKTSVWDAWRWA